jgi:hypothetical protein
MKNQKLILGFSIGASILILVAAWLYVQHVAPPNEFPFSGGTGLLKLMALVFGIALAAAVMVFLGIKAIWPPISGMSLKEYWLRPDERTLRLRYQTGTYVLSFISFYFVAVWSFCRVYNPALGIELMFWGYLASLFFGVVLIFRFLERRS